MEQREQQQRSEQEHQHHRPKVFLTTPVYQQLPIECLHNSHGCSELADVVPYHRGEAYVDKNFSELWTEALNSREAEGWTHFAMIHVDVKPLVRQWLDVLLIEMARTGADLLAAVLPIKTGHGYSSTCIMDDDGSWRRLTMREVDCVGAMTFDAEQAGFPGKHLRVATGLWIADFTRPWVEDVWFQTHCRIVKQLDGKFKTVHLGEDWDFSRQLHKLGLRVLATKALPAEHWGMFPFVNDRPWGTVKHDEWHQGADWVDQDQGQQRETETCRQCSSK